MSNVKFKKKGDECNFLSYLLIKQSFIKNETLSIQCHHNLRKLYD